MLPLWNGGTTWPHTVTSAYPPTAKVTPQVAQAKRDYSANHKNTLGHLSAQGPRLVAIPDALIQKVKKGKFGVAATPPPMQAPKAPEPEVPAEEAVAEGAETVEATTDEETVEAAE